MEKILITGGTGYIGSHTVCELIAAGFETVIIDNLSNSSIQVLSGIEKITGVRPEFAQFDLLDKERLYAFSKQHNLAAIIHFAAFKAVGESVGKPIEYYNNNLGSLLNILDVFGPEQKLVFSSSCTVYGQPDKLPVNEEAPFKKAESPYGNTKQQCEEILSFAARAAKVRAISLRYFNPVGAHPSSEIGELPNGTPNNLVPFITQTAIGKRPQLTVFGDDYNTPDGSCVRDYIHVVDLAKAHVVATRRLSSEQTESRLDTFNLGTGKGSSVLEVIRMFETVSGVKLNYKIGPRRPGDVEQVYGDPTKAEHVLGWKAELSLIDMVKTAWDWEKHLAQ